MTDTPDTRRADMFARLFTLALSKDRSDLDRMRDLLKELQRDEREAILKIGGALQLASALRA